MCGCGAVTYYTRTSGLRSVVVAPPLLFFAGSIVFKGRDLMPLRENAIRQVRGKDITVPWSGIKLARDQQKVVVTLQQPLMPAASPPSR